MRHEEDQVILSLAQIDQGVELLFANASSLCDESRRLLEASSWPRAFALAHLAREEMSKIIMLQAAGLKSLAGHEVNWKRLSARLRDHKSKLRQETVEDAILLKGMGVDEKLADLALSNVDAAVGYRNKQKNAALYVGFNGKDFVSPSETITQRQAERTVMLAELRLQMLGQERQLIGRLSEREIGSFAEVGELVKGVTDSQDIGERIEILARALATVRSNLPPPADDA